MLDNLIMLTNVLLLIETKCLQAYNSNTIIQKGVKKTMLIKMLVNMSIKHICIFKKRESFTCLSQLEVCIS